MPLPRDLDDALDQLMRHNGVSRAEALQHVEDQVTQGKAEYVNIPGIQDALKDEHIRNFAGATATSFLDAFTSPGRFLTRTALAFTPKNIAASVEPLIGGQEQAMSEVESRSPVGSLVGGIGALAVPGGPGEVSRALEYAPIVGKVAEEGRFLKPILRGALGGAAQGEIGALGRGETPIPFTGRALDPMQAGFWTGGLGGAAGATWDLLAKRGIEAVAKSPESVLGSAGAEARPAGPEWSFGGEGPRRPGSVEPDETVIDPSEAKAEAWTDPLYEERIRSLEESLGRRLTPEEREAYYKAARPKSETAGARASAEQFARQARAPADDLFQGVRRAPVAGTAAGTPPFELRPEAAVQPGQLEYGPWRGPSPFEPGPRLEDEPSAPAPAEPIGAPAPSRVAGPSEKQAWFAVPPAKREGAGFMRTAEDLLRESSHEPIGTLTMREGQPFEVRAHNVVDGQRRGLQVFAYPTSSLGRAGAPGKALLQKPMIIDVPSTGQQAFIDAARALYAGDPKVLKALDGAKDPIGLAQELIARRAKTGGFDAVNLSTPDVKENVIVRVGGHFKPSAHPDFREAGQAKPGPFRGPLKADEFLERPMGGPEAITRETLNKLRAAAKATREAVEPGSSPEARDFHNQVSGITNDDIGAYHPAWQAAIRQMGEASLEPWSTWRPVASSIAHPLFDRMMMRTLDAEVEANKFVVTMDKISKALRAAIPEKRFDEVHRALMGLRYDDNGRLVQTALNVRPEDTKLATTIQKDLLEPGYHYLTNNDPKLLSLLERRKLPHTRAQLERLRTIQGGPTDPAYIAMYASRRPPTLDEEIAAATSRGWLGFDDSHDLDIEYGKGFLSFYPVENERAKVQDAIKVLDAHKSSGYGSFNADQTKAMLQKYIARLDYIDKQDERVAYRGYPRTDVFPKHKLYGPLLSASDPSARPLFPDKNVESILAKFVRGIADKRQSDTVLYEAGQLLKHPDFQRGDVRSIITDYANARRGSRGYAGDRRFAESWNNGIGRLPGAPKLTAQDVHEKTSFIMSGTLFTRIQASPFRFPFINLTHMFSGGLYGIVGEKTFARAVADVMANPKRWFGEAAEAGAIRAESDWLRELASPGTKVGQGKWMRRFLTLTYASENFRRAVAYRAGLLTDPEDWSPLVKAFYPKGHASELAARKAYARGLTMTTQFDASMVNKPLAFSGSPYRRLLSQFKTWPANIAALYADAIRKKQWGFLTRSMPALYYFGGPAALIPGGPIIYDFIRDHLLRHGVNLPQETGAENLADTLGLQGAPWDFVFGFNLYSLHDPLALIPPSVSGLTGPFIGGAIDTASQVTQAINNEDADGLGRTVLRGISPQAEAAYEGVEEFFNNGRVFGADGHLELQRPLMASLVRALDFAPSGRSIYQSTLRDMASAYESGNMALVQKLRSKATRDGVVMSGKFWRSVQQIVKKRAKNRRTADELWGEAEAELQ